VLLVGPHTWNGFSVEAFSGLWDFLKLSAAAEVMLCYSLSQSFFYPYGNLILGVNKISILRLTLLISAFYFSF